jgi:hypothetical protein
MPPVSHERSAGTPTRRPDAAREPRTVNRYADPPAGCRREVRDGEPWQDGGVADQSRKPRPNGKGSSQPGGQPGKGGGTSRPASPSTGTRKQIEDASRPTLVKLSSLPRLVVPLGTLVLVVIGLFAPLPIALPALALIFFFFAWIAYLSWPVVPTGGRVLRGVMLGLVLAMAASRF